MVPGVISAPLLLSWYNGDVQQVIFFFFVTFIKIIYFGVGHWLDHWTHDHKVVGTKEIEMGTTAESLRFRLYPVFFFFFFLNLFWNNCFLDGSMRSCCFWLLYVNMSFGTKLVPIFLILSPLGETNYFWNKITLFRWFHVVPGGFGSFLLTCFI